jgi:hypothetical protein
LSASDVSGTSDTAASVAMLTLEPVIEALAEELTAAWNDEPA